MSGVIAAINGVWDEELSAADEDARFAEAVAFATGVLERELRGAAAYQRALALVRGAIERSADPRVVELDRKLPWHETVVTTAPQALYVIYPKSDGWGMQAVPKTLGEFENRKDLPEEWAGHSGEDLAAVTGVPDAIFAHTKRFYASAGSREGILALAAQALAALTDPGSSAAATNSSIAARCARTRSTSPSSTPRADSIPPAALVRCSLIRRTSSSAPSARSTSARSAGASSPSTPPRAISTRARASEYATWSAKAPSSGS